MVGKYPVMLNEKESGTLTITRQGVKYNFDAFCPDTDVFIRLSVYGNGKEGYLGVMQPENGGMRLRRSLSLNAVSKFPEKISYAGQRGERPKVKIQPAPSQVPEKVLEVDTLWSADALGVLWCEEYGQSLCAVPKRLGIVYQGEELPERDIEGTNYRVFKFEAGKNRL